MKINFYCSVAVTQLRLAELEKNRKFDQLVCIAKDAAAAWSSIIQGVLDIQINCVFVEANEMLDSSAFGICIPNFITINRGDLAGSRASKFGYSLITTAQAKALGTALVPEAGNIDMVIFINFDLEYNVTQSAVSLAAFNQRNYKRSFKTIFMHEICHGLGFGASWDKDNKCTDLNIINYPADIKKLLPYVPFLNYLEHLVAEIQKTLPYPVTPFAQFFELKNKSAYEDSIQRYKNPNITLICNTHDAEHITVFLNKNASDTAIDKDGEQSEKREILTLMNSDVSTQVLAMPDEYTIFILNQIFWRFNPPSNAWCNIL